MKCWMAGKPPPRSIPAPNPANKKSNPAILPSAEFVRIDIIQPMIIRHFKTENPDIKERQYPSAHDLGP
jgi:hypothetical protein